MYYVKYHHADPASSAPRTRDGTARNDGREKQLARGVTRRGV